MVTLVQAPRGLDVPVGSVGLIDADDVGFGLATGADNADLFCLVGVPEDVVLRWPDGPVRLSIAIFIKEPTDQGGQAGGGRRGGSGGRRPAGPLGAAV